MKRIIYTLLSLIMTALTVGAQGWPAQYDGVMLQGFWWDSYQQTRWTNLEKQADELSQYFQLIWIPQSGYCNSLTNQMGYSDIWWLDHKSAFGTEAELRSMINTFKQKGTGIIEDVVINHKNGNTNWCDFPNESKNGYTLTWDNQSYSAICKTDECNRNGYKTTGANDTGDDFDGCRDLDHTNAQVQQNVKTYLSFLLNDLGYAGFRYDMVKGYDPKYTGQYNVAAQPQFSVGEYWDRSASAIRSWVDGTKVGGKVQSAAFDFTMKYQINSAFQNGQWNALTNNMLTKQKGYSRYSVTFVDNHDTGKNPANTSDGPLGKNVCAANAYILAMPGTPCVWLKHWVDYKGTLKRLIAARHAAGLNNESEIVASAVTTDGFTLNVRGTKGEVMLVLGNAEPAAGNWQLAVEGVNFQYYVSAGIDLSAVRAVTDEDSTQEAPAKVVVPGFCTVDDGELCAFFESPASWGNTVHCWAWTNSPSDNFTYANKGWPGVACTLIGTADNGNKVWKWSWDGTKQKNSAATQPVQIIFNNNTSPQTADLDFVNAGYYTMDGLQANVLTTIKARTAASSTVPVKVYTLGGKLVAVYPPGTSVRNALLLLRPDTYIVNGTKVISPMK